MTAMNAHEIDELRKLPMPDLVAAYEEAWGKPPRVKHREYLWKRVSWKREEANAGGLSVKAKERLEELIAELDIDLGDRSVSGVLRNPKNKRKRKSKQLTPGTTITRPWKDGQVVVRVLDQGFEFDGEIYRSLTAITKKVTGSHWSGPAFFRLNRRKSE